jgi:hypothetical protein
MRTVKVEDIRKLDLCISTEEFDELAAGRTKCTGLDIIALDRSVEDKLCVLLTDLFFDKSDLKMMAAAFAWQSLKYYEREYPGDYRPRDAIRVTRLYAMGEATSTELAAAWAAAGAAAKAASWAATRDAASDAAGAAARAAARAASRDAASDAAGAAAWAAAGAAARAAAWDAQIEIVKIYLGGQDDE